MSSFLVLLLLIVVVFAYFWNIPGTTTTTRESMYTTEEYKRQVRLVLENLDKKVTERRHKLLLDNKL